MGTICKYVIAAPRADAVEVVSSFLRAHGHDFLQTESEWPALGAPGSIHLSERFPTIWAANESKGEFVQVYVNSWTPRLEFASFASFQLRTLLVVNLYQSTADGCYWAFYDRGECKREIETTQEPEFEARGAKLSFENDQIGTDISDGEGDPFFIYSYEDMDFYNAGVGVDVEVYEQHDPGWTNWAVIEPGLRLNKTTGRPGSSRKWWRFGL